jgi:hypothetical protein
MVEEFVGNKSVLRFLKAYLQVFFFFSIMCFFFFFFYNMFIILTVWNLLQLGGIYKTPKFGCTQKGQTAGINGVFGERLSCKKQSVQSVLSQHCVLFMEEG